jgi:aminoglycoside/choline kinase family phosphotransferase
MSSESPRPEVARERVDAFLNRTGLRKASVRVVPLTGDASDRRYFRLITGDGRSSVLALYAQPFEFETLPFVNVARLFQAVPLPIPEILDHADDLGVLLLQDLGDVTLQAHLGAAVPTEHASLYREAVSFLVRLQKRGRELASPAFIPFGVAFDPEKLRWELDFFVKHFVESYRGVRLPAGIRKALTEEWAPIIDELASEPRVLCHRDYHSRNLMFIEGRLYIIDFQDARMGPDTYDLVSLLRDSYLDLPEETVDELVSHFLSLGSAEGAPTVADQQEFRRRFDLMALQRNLKALGTFGFQTAARGNPVYIQYIPRTLRYVRTNLLRHARFARLYELLAAHIEELR